MKLAARQFDMSVAGRDQQVRIKAVQAATTFKVGLVIYYEVIPLMTA